MGHKRPVLRLMSIGPRRPRTQVLFYSTRSMQISGDNIILPYVEIKCQLDATDEFLLQILLLAQHVSGNSPQTWRTTLSSTPYRQLENQAPNTTGSNHLYNTLELLMMGIMVPETCWASNKICNKNHLLHLVGILFPHCLKNSTYVWTSDCVAFPQLTICIQ